MENTEYEDIFFEKDFKPQPVILISDEKKLKIMSRPTSFPILMSLRGGFRTVREIEEDYVKYLEKQAKKKGMSKKDIKTYIKDGSRAEKTFYKYIQDLIEHGFIVTIGKRVAHDKPMTEKLFARTADFFFIDGFYEKTSSAEPQCVESIAKLTSLVYDVPEVNEKTVFNFSRSFIDSTKKITEILFGDKAEKFVKIVDGLNLEEVMTVIQMLSLIELVSSREEYSELLKLIGR